MTIPHARTPSAEIEIDAALVRGLLREQFPALSRELITPVGEGWDNAMFRLGDTLAVRLPRRAASAPLIEKEQRWLPLIAKRLPLPVPAALHIGKPGHRYPWSWSIVPWLAGDSADLSKPASGQSGRLVEFLRALHQPAPGDAPLNPFRGVALQVRAEVVEERIRRLWKKSSALTDKICRLWTKALDAPNDEPATWIHGDLHARNVLVENGRISAVIDWGDLAAGDRATDLASIWMVLTDLQDRVSALHIYEHATEATWSRARGWAVLFGVFLLETGLNDHPRHAAMGKQILRNLAEGP